MSAGPVTPKRSLAPKSLSYAANGVNEHQAIGNNTNNGCLDLARPMHSFGADLHNNGIVSAINESVTNSPLMQTNGCKHFIRTVTTTTTTTTTKTVMENIMVSDEIPKSQFLLPMPVIDIGMFHFCYAISEMTNFFSLK